MHTSDTHTPLSFATALPTERDLRRIRRKAAELRAAHLRSLFRRLAAALHRFGGNDGTAPLGEHRA